MTMKKDIRTLAALLMAGAAFAACSSDDNIIDETQQPANPTGKYTMIVNATKGNDGTTRALDLTGDKKLNVKWAATDQVSVFPEAWSTTTTLTPMGTLTAAASDDGNTTLTGDLTTLPSSGDKLNLLFPRATWDYTEQKGILLSDANSIEKKYDYALAKVTVDEVTGNTITTTADADFESQQAIVKFNLKDAGGSSISASSLTISAASGKLVQSRGMKPTYNPAGYEDVSGLTGYYVYVETSGAADTEDARVMGKDGMDDWVFFNLDDSYGSGGCKVVSGAYVYRYKANNAPTKIKLLQLISQTSPLFIL